MKDIIDKAVKGGYKIFWENHGEWNFCDDDGNIISEGYGDIQYESIIFSHDFLKAFFGEEFVCDYCGEINCDCLWKSNIELSNLPVVKILKWGYHAQQLVLSTDRKKYLKRFI